MYKKLIKVDKFKKNLNFLIQFLSESCFDDVYSA